MSVGTVNLIEAVWTLVAILGFVVQAAILRDVFADRRAMKGDPDGGNGRRWRLVRGHFRSGGIFLFVHFVFAWAGVSSMLEPEDEQPMTFSRAVRIGIFIAAAVALVVAGLWDRHDRSALRQPRGER